MAGRLFQIAEAAEGRAFMSEVARKCVKKGRKQLLNEQKKVIREAGSEAEGDVEMDVVVPGLLVDDHGSNEFSSEPEESKRVVVFIYNLFGPLLDVSLHLSDKKFLRFFSPK